MTATFTEEEKSELMQMKDSVNTLTKKLDVLIARDTRDHDKTLPYSDESDSLREQQRLYQIY